MKNTTHLVRHQVRTSLSQKNEFDDLQRNIQYELSHEMFDEAYTRVRGNVRVRLGLAIYRRACELERKWI